MSISDYDLSDGAWELLQKLATDQGKTPKDLLVADQVTGKSMLYQNLRQLIDTGLIGGTIDETKVRYRRPSRFSVTPKGWDALSQLADWYHQEYLKLIRLLGSRKFD